MTVLDKWKQGLDATRTVVEIIALVVAGLWAYSKFAETEKPSLETRGRMESTLKWYPVASPTHCLGQFAVSLTNIGQTSIDIDRVRLRIWVVPFPPADQTNAVTYVDTTKFQDGTAVLDRDMGMRSLVGHYPPNVHSQFDYVFLTRKTGSSVAVVRLDARTPGGRHEFTESRWEEVCGPLATEGQRIDSDQKPPDN